MKYAHVSNECILIGTRAVTLKQLLARQCWWLIVLEILYNTRGSRVHHFAWYECGWWYSCRLYHKSQPNIHMYIDYWKCVCGHITIMCPRLHLLAYLFRREKACSFAIKFLHHLDLKWQRFYVIAWPYNCSLKLELSSNETLDFGKLMVSLVDASNSPQSLCLRSKKWRSASFELYWMFWRLEYDWFRLHTRSTFIFIGLHQCESSSNEKKFVVSFGERKMNGELWFESRGILLALPSSSPANSQMIIRN